MHTRRNDCLGWRRDAKKDSSATWRLSGRDAVRRYKVPRGKANRYLPFASPTMLSPSAVCSTRSPLMLSFGSERHGISPIGEKHRVPLIRLAQSNMISGRERLPIQSALSAMKASALTIRAAITHKRAFVYV